MTLALKIAGGLLAAAAVAAGAGLVGIALLWRVEDDPDE